MLIKFKGSSSIFCQTSWWSWKGGQGFVFLHINNSSATLSCILKLLFLTQRQTFGIESFLAFPLLPAHSLKDTLHLHTLHWSVRIAAKILHQTEAASQFMAVIYSFIKQYAQVVLNEAETPWLHPTVNWGHKAKVCQVSHSASCCQHAKSYHTPLLNNWHFKKTLFYSHKFQSHSSLYNPSINASSEVVAKVTGSKKKRQLNSFTAISTSELEEKERRLCASHVKYSQVSWCVSFLDP